MGFSSTTTDTKTAPSKIASCAQKTASREIFSSNRRFTYKIERNPLKTQQEESNYTYKIASGRGTWLGRDPIEESGGDNLYAFVGSDPVNNWDYLGLATPEQWVRKMLKKLAINKLIANVRECPRITDTRTSCLTCVWLTSWTLQLTNAVVHETALLGCLKSAKGWKGKLACIAAIGFSQADLAGQYSDIQVQTAAKCDKLACKMDSSNDDDSGFV